MCVNLLNETITALGENGKNETDVLWVGTRDGECSWAEFARVAADLNYDNGYGRAEISFKLVIVGKDFWLERAEYDGSEEWKIKEPLVKKGRRVKPTEDLLLRW